MNQRILSCPSTLLTKGLTMKVGEWKTSEATPELLDVCLMKRSPSSSASLPNSWKLTRNNSSSLLREHIDVHRISSSSLSQTKLGASNTVSSQSSMGNASWDDKVTGGLAPKQNHSSRLSVNLLDLVQLKMDDPFNQHGQRAIRSALPSPSEPVAVEAPRRQHRRLSTIIDTSSPEEQDEPFRSSSSTMNASADEEEDENVVLDVLLDMSRDREEDFLVKTFNEKPPTTMDFRSTSTSELDSLKEKDPFMYYSIPAVRKAAFRGKDVDLHAVKAGTASDIPSSYARKTCISVESCLLPDMDELDSRGLPSLRSTFYINMDIDDDEDEDADDWLYEFSGIQAV